MDQHGIISTPFLVKGFNLALIARDVIMSHKGYMFSGPDPNYNIQIYSRN